MPIPSRTRTAGFQTEGEFEAELEPLPEEVLERFPALRQWDEARRRKHRDMIQTLRAKIEALEQAVTDLRRSSE